MNRLYPKAFENRLPVTDPRLRGTRRAFFRTAGFNFLLLQLLFLGLFCWIFGSLFQETGHVHNVSILFVDYDKGAVGAALRNAYKGLAGPDFPSLVEHDSSALMSPSVLR